jgi:tetratricopeptide (TPR) repeat protein
MIRSILLSLCLASPVSAALSPTAEGLLNEGVTHLYDLDYEQSRASFRRLIELEPNNPFSYLFESGGIWWQSSQEYGLFTDTPTLQGQFEDDIEFALKKAEPLLKSSDPAIQADGHFVTGMALGTRGQWSLMRGHMLRACFDGRKAVKHLQKCLKADGSYSDANLGLGVFNYQAARLPKALKFSAALCGAKGNEAQGMSLMNDALEKGRLGSRQAAQFLTSIYITDLHDYARALALTQRLRKDFPLSPYFHFLEVALRFRLGDWDGSVAEGRVLFRNQQGDMKAFARKWLSLFCGLSGAQCLEASNAKLAHDWLNHALEAEPKRPKDAAEPPGFGPAWTSYLRLYRGNASDLLGKHEDAVADYNAVLQAPDFFDFHARAAECSAVPCTAVSMQRYLRAKSTDAPWPPPPAPVPAAKK